MCAPSEASSFPDLQAVEPRLELDRRQNDVCRLRVEPVDEREQHHDESQHAAEEEADHLVQPFVVRVVVPVRRLGFGDSAGTVRRGEWGVDFGPSYAADGGTGCRTLGGGRRGR
eukprot:scaffold18114_cov79-Isochrysis_galbana.AAC.1